MSYKLQARIKLSVAAAPYLVTFKNGKKQFHSHIATIYRDLNQRALASVYDRHLKAYLDIETLFKSHRRKRLKPDV